MTPPYEPDPQGGAEGSPGARPEDQQWWASRVGGEPLVPGVEERQPAFEDRWWTSRTGGEPLVPGVDESRLAAPGLREQPLAETTYVQAPADTAYEAWAPSASVSAAGSRWTSSGDGSGPYMPPSATGGPYVRAGGGAGSWGLIDRGLIDRALIDLPRPLTDADTGRSAAYLLVLSVIVGIVAALVLVLVAAIVFSTLLSSGG